MSSEATSYYRYFRELLTAWLSSEEESTASKLSLACDAHILSKQRDIDNIRRQEEEQRAALGALRSEAESAIAARDEETRSLRAYMDTATNRLLALREAIDVVVGNREVSEDAVEAIRQTFVMAENFSSATFAERSSAIASAIAQADREVDRTTRREEGARAKLREIEGERRVVESHVDEIRNIQRQLDERLAPRGTDVGSNGVVAVMAEPIPTGEMPDGWGIDEK